MHDRPRSSSQPPTGLSTTPGLGEPPPSKSTNARGGLPAHVSAIDWPATPRGDKRHRTRRLSHDRINSCNIRWPRWVPRLPDGSQAAQTIKPPGRPTTSGGTRLHRSHVSGTVRTRTTTPATAPCRALCLTRLTRLAAKHDSPQPPLGGQAITTTDHAPPHACTHSLEPLLHLPRGKVMTEREVQQT